MRATCQLMCESISCKVINGCKRIIRSDLQQKRWPRRLRWALGRIRKERLEDGTDNTSGESC